MRSAPAKIDKKDLLVSSRELRADVQSAASGAPTKVKARGIDERDEIKEASEDHTAAGQRAARHGDPDDVELEREVVVGAGAHGTEKKTGVEYNPVTLQP